MKNKKSQQQHQATKKRIKYISNIIIKYALIFIFTMAILMVLPKWEKYIIYTFAFLCSATVLLVIKNKYISVKRLGLGKTRSVLEKEINRYYFKNILITFVCLALLVLIDYLAYHLSVNIWFVIYLYLFGLCLFTVPLNYLLNIRQNRIIRIIILVLSLMILVISSCLYFMIDLFYLSYFAIIATLIILFIFRQRGYNKKDL